MRYTPILLALLLLPVAAALTDASLQRYDPTPAQPGDLLTVHVSLTNDANDIARNVQLELLPTSTIKPEGQTTINAGSIGARGTYTATLRARVARDAPAGDAVLRMRVKEDGSDWQERTGIITVQALDGSVLINNVGVEPETINPGRTSTVTLTVENIAGSLLRDVTTQLDLADTPFVPDKSTTRKKVNELGPDKSAQISYQLTAQPDAEAGIYRVPVTISFLGEDGETQTEEDTLGMTVTTEQKTIALVDNVAQTEQGTEVTVRIINTGLSEIKFLQASVSDQEGYTIQAQHKQAYLGNVDSDDWETMRFTVSTDQESVDIPLTYSYEDTFNNAKQEQATLSVNIPPAQSGMSAGTIALIAVLLIGGGYWLYKRRKS